MPEPKKHVVTIRLEVDDDMLAILAKYYGQKKATLRDYRAWAHGSLLSDFEVIEHDFAERDLEDEED